MKFIHRFVAYAIAALILMIVLDDPKPEIPQQCLEYVKQVSIAESAQNRREFTIVLGILAAIVLDGVLTVLVTTLLKNSSLNKHIDEIAYYNYWPLFLETADGTMFKLAYDHDIYIVKYANTFDNHILSNVHKKSTHVDVYTAPNGSVLVPRSLKHCLETKPNHLTKQEVLYYKKLTLEWIKR